MELYQFPWEDSAGRGLPLPEGLPLADQMAYMGLRHIYWAFHGGRLTVGGAHYEKTKLRKEYEAVKAELAFDKKITAYHVELIKEIEAAQCRYRKERTLEAADHLSAVLDGHIIKHQESEDNYEEHTDGPEQLPVRTAGASDRRLHGRGADAEGDHPE